MTRRCTSLLPQNGLTTEVNTRSYEPTREEAATSQRPKNSLNTKNCTVKKGKHHQIILRTRCWPVVIVVFMVWFFVITNIATITITYHIWCPGTRPDHKEEHKLGRTCCDTNQTVQIYFGSSSNWQSESDNPNFVDLTNTYSHAHF